MCHKKTAQCVTQIIRFCSLPSSSSSRSPIISANAVGSKLKLLDEGNVICRRDNNDGLVGFLKDLTLLSSADSLLSRGGFSS